jgi:CubicO group peptidase (beta-lactamase class C family)
MVSTAADYARFGQLWLNGGQLDGVRLLSRKTVELMTADHLPPGIKAAPAASLNPNALSPTPERAVGFGLGFAVRLSPGRSPMYGSAGEFYWAGIYGTNFVIDPKEKLITVLMIQAQARGSAYRNLMRQLTHQALAD